MDLQNESSICNFYNNQINKRTNDIVGVVSNNSLSGQYQIISEDPNQRNLNTNDYNRIIEELQSRIESVENENH